jgi:hypothetical protein
LDTPVFQHWLRIIAFLKKINQAKPHPQVLDMRILSVLLTESLFSPIISHYVMHSPDHPQYRPHWLHSIAPIDVGKTTVTDFDPEEQERGITIQAAAHF